MKKVINKHFEKIKENKLTKFFFGKPIQKFVTLLIMHFLTLIIIPYLPNTIWGNIISIIDLLVAFYFVVLLIYLIRKSFDNLMNPKNLSSLIFAYISFILVMILVFSAMFNFIQTNKFGNIQYGGCSNKFDANSIQSNPDVSREFFYFASVTFFTVGYGDICPMGFAKTMAIIVSFIGHIVSVIFVALVLNRYLRKQNE